MATYAELQAEPWWDMETIPPNLRILVERLQKHYGLGWNAIGCKGDNRHLRGAHRSRRWIRASRYCTNRVYTVSRTPGDREGGDDDWLVGLDATIPRDALIAACQRLDRAVRAGKLEKITEWYGNDDGDNRVDGYDNISNSVASSDDSHLWHLHLTFDRGRANEDHTDVYEILTGEGNDVGTVDGQQGVWLYNTAMFCEYASRGADAYPARTGDNKPITVDLKPYWARIAAEVAKNPVGTVTVDVDEAAIAEEVADELHRRTES